ncbi:hypothetical protein CYMTET_34837 [Cymbomonas tetramitiformis]|uniref:Uncharacterized protein n=1 Tax=Cymbomonas tetramitiformis TaxID=36881 RepID=A0AAE0KPT6_9CHLO|nr:hypothetical protein CYMTET_34837 [Cymbomonas tetramitiformis]
MQATSDDLPITYYSPNTRMYQIWEYEGKSYVDMTDNFVWVVWVTNPYQLEAEQDHVQPFDGWKLPGDY